MQERDYRRGRGYRGDTSTPDTGETFSKGTGSAGICHQLLNSACGGHCIHNKATRTARLMTRAMMVSTVESLRLGAPGHIPEKRAIPTVEMIAETTASCLHTPPGTNVPQKDKADAMKPTVDRSQNMLAITAAARNESAGKSHERTGSVEEVSTPAAVARSAKNALPWASP